MVKRIWSVFLFILFLCAFTGNGLTQTEADSPGLTIRQERMTLPSIPGARNKPDKVLPSHSEQEVALAGTPTWVPIMTEDFEGTFPTGLWTVASYPEGGPTWGRDDYLAHTGTWSAWCAASALDPAFNNYPNNMLGYMTYGPFDLRGATDAEVSFYLWLQREECCDGFAILASIDGENYGGYVYTEIFSGWEIKTFDLKSVPYLGNLCGQPEVWIAFGFQSDPSNTYKGAFVDDIVLQKYADVPATVSLMVTLEPAGARSAGAQWRVDEGSWTGSGATVSSLTSGNHAVEYKEITGFSRPTSPETVSVIANPTSITRTYVSTGHAISGTVTLDSVGLSGVTVTLSGDGTGSTVTASGGNYSFAGLNNGNYTLTTALSGYIFDPASRQVTVAGADVTGINFTAIRCTYAITPEEESFSPSGGTGTVEVTATDGCGWSAVSNAAWIAITSGDSGTGNGTVNYSVSVNNSPGQREGTITIGGETFTVTQEGITCTYSISPTSQIFAGSGGTGTVHVTTEDPCGWTAESYAAWITITSGNSGTGDGTVNYTVAANTTKRPRMGTIIAAGKSVTVRQRRR